MAYIAYTASRSLVAGHTAGSSYTINFDASVAEKSRKRQVDAQISLGGIRDTLLHRIEYSYQAGTDAIPHAEKPNWEEFADSVAAGETFVLDLYGTSTTPVEPLTVSLPQDADVQITRRDSTMFYDIRFTAVS